MLVREGQDATHLLAHREAGDWFTEHGQLTAALERLLAKTSVRAEVSAVVAPFHAQKIPERLLEEAMIKAQTP